MRIHSSSSVALIGLLFASACAVPSEREPSRAESDLVEPATTAEPAPSPPPPAFDFTPSAACKKHVEQTLPGLGWTGEYLEVPRDRSQPVSATNPRVKVFFYWDASRDLSTSTPILFFNGGPVSTGHARTALIAKRLNEFDPQKKFVFVMMDQRGTGCSAPTIPVAGESLSAMKVYGSSDIVDDAEAFRIGKLGSRKLRIFAQSYGGVLSHRYLAKYPGSIESIHNHAPVHHRNFTDFFSLRVLRQQQIVKRFFARYAADQLERAFALATPDLCTAKPANGEAACGRVLVDGVLAAIGQGYGRDGSFVNGQWQATTEVWDGIRKNLLDLIEGRTADFLTAAESSLAFFRNPTSLGVTVVWSQDLDYIDGDNSTDCDAAYARLEQDYGLKKQDLVLDECRIIQQARPKAFGAQLKAEFASFKGTNKITHQDILKKLAENPSIDYRLYTGDFDTLVQVPSVTPLVSSPRVEWTHFPNSGHAGWTSEPKVWQTLLAPPAATP